MIYCLMTSLVSVLLAVDGVAQAIRSLDTGHTVMKVRVARDPKQAGGSYVVASSYEGALIGLDREGVQLWKNPLSGYMNADVWCADLTGDGVDEILAANADGSVYCVDAKGQNLWQFKDNDVPMNAVCAVKRGGKSYVYCGGYDTSLYILSSSGKRLKEIRSTSYSIEKTWGQYKARPANKTHAINFLRPYKRLGQEDALLVHATNHSLSGNGSLYFFEALDEAPYKTMDVGGKGTVGELRLADVDGDGNDDVLVGRSTMLNHAGFTRINPVDESSQRFEYVRQVRKHIDGFGYRVEQPLWVGKGSKGRFLNVLGSRIILAPVDMSPRETEVLVSKYSFNDVWHDDQRDTLILASAQSGGSCIHLVNLKTSDWKKAYEGLNPPGNIAAILEHHGKTGKQLAEFNKPAWERDTLPVYFMSESLRGPERAVADRIQAKHDSPIFLKSTWTNHAENWDRSSMTNAKYRDRRDGRRTYDWTPQQALDWVTPLYKQGPGVSYWGGHGNDPFMFQLSTTKQVLDTATANQKTVLIFPELEDHSEDFNYVMDNLIYPLAEYGQSKNTNLYIRCKHSFWYGSAYMPIWSGLLSGEFADVFVPSMEETTDKSMELSLSARMGLWASGSVNSWGSRCARDNPSFDRLRQHSHQMLPNHFLRMMIYHISSGAQFLDNFSVDQMYMSQLWELIASGAIYVPKRSEIVSFSPVHLSIVDPDIGFFDEASNVKWTSFYDKAKGEGGPEVFGRLNGSWPGAANTEWDFSRYAAGVSDRRLNFLPPYENGLVLMTPAQSGRFADLDAPRGALADNLHPIYKDILKEHATDGRHYRTLDGRKKMPADVYYRQVAQDIQGGGKKLPLTVAGQVAWVTAETAPKHLRLTLIDGGYINPKASTATVRFHAAKPVKITDLLSGETFDISDPDNVQIPIDCGGFRFLDIEIAEPLVALAD